MRSRAGVLALLLVAVACDDLPRDPRGTLQRVRSGALRAGAIAGSPESRQPLAAEKDRVRALADHLSARVEWRTGSESELLGALERFQLDLVVGGLTLENPWRGRVAFAPMSGNGGRVPVWAVPPGENRWLLEVERHLRRSVRQANAGR